MAENLQQLYEKLKDKTFYKVSASGNDFIVLLNFDNIISLDEGKVLAQRLCRPKFSVSADGFILLEKPENSNAQVKWVFYNSDGSLAEMCGNGARAVGRLLSELKLFSFPFFLETLAGLIHIEVKGKRVKVSLGKARDLKLNLTLKSDYDLYLVHFVNTGVPHTVLFWEEVDSAPVEKIGPLIRYHEAFKPSGTNVNFVEIVKTGEKGFLKIRTYERGVEGETLACGTGATASAYITYKLGLMQFPIEVLTRGGEILIIDMDKDETLYLEGDTRYLFEFKIYEDALL